MRISAAFGIALLAVATVATESPKSQSFTSSDGVKIHYLELGQGGTPVLLSTGTRPMPRANGSSRASHKRSRPGIV